MSKAWLARVFKLERFTDSSGFERANTKLVKHRTFHTKAEALVYKFTMEEQPDVKVVIKPNE
ncbi:hypothetical protein KGP40_02795 [Weissella cibaria]|uniref:hypothetical protein n=1 Tax=Weissella cibaria TaxID=137591 RepID=UPI001C1F507F|nr:hypothetical protein [Weissella cibaria]MBU7560848.1 hypothetical protein [Weissella cibaria]